LSLAACLDDKAGSSTQAGVVPVQSTGATAGNAAPTVAGTPASEIPAGFPYVFKPSVTDPEGDPLTFEIQGAPAWATFNPATGELRGTPTDADVGDATGIVIKVSDGKATTSFGPFSVKVKRAGTSTGTVGARSPTISGTPVTTVVAGAGYVFQALGTDPDGDRLTYGAANLPSWLGINTANGVLTGTPSVAQVGSYANITVSVTDGNSTASLAAFTITVTAPAAGSTAGTTTTSSAWTQCATEGETCSFSGTQQVRFGEPFGNRWTAARTLTGPVPCTNAYWGDPSPGTGKRCEVMDASLTLAPTTSSTDGTTATGTATLVWQRPLQNTDGTPLTDLAGFVIKYGTDPASLSQTVTLRDANATRFTLDKLGPGTWYFTVASLTAAGLESDLSPRVSKTIN
jgi:hypothetical protein